MRGKYLAAFLLAVAVISGGAFAGAIGGGGGSSGLSASLVCLLSGGADCAMTGHVRLSTTAGVATTGANFSIYDLGNAADLVISPFSGVTGLGYIHSADANGSAIALSTSAGLTVVGQKQNQGANALTAGFGDTIDPVGGSASVLGGMAGGGLWQIAQAQAVACAAGVLALDPTSSVVDIDANGAACAVTLGESIAAALGPGVDVTINIVTSAGAGVVTFPDVADTHDGPTLCTTTGLALNGSYTIHYADKANDMWIGKACTAN